MNKHIELNKLCVHQQMVQRLNIDMRGVRREINNVRGKVNR